MSDIPSSVVALIHPPEANFLQLPNELIFLIMDNLDSDAVAALGCVCRRLNHLSIWYYIDSTLPQFAHLGLSTDSEPSHPFSALRLFHLSLLETQLTIPSMRLTFSPDFGAELARVLHFIKCIDYVPMVQVDFKELLFAPQEGQTMSNVYDTFSKFCTELTTLDCIGWTLGHNVEALEQLLSSSTTDFAPAPFTSLYAVIIPIQARKMTDWIIRSLNNSPIHVLVMDCAMEAILAEVTLPHLTNFTGIYTVNTGQVSVDVVTFLGRHPSLTMIFLGAKSFKPRDIERVRSALQPLPVLDSMSASLDVLNVWLSKPLLFPALQEISVQGPIIDVHLGTREEHFVLLSSILILIGRITGVWALKLPFLNHFDGNAWNTHLSPTRRPEAFLTNVKKVGFYSPSVLMMTDIRESFDLIRTISYFPAVEVVEIEDRYFLDGRDEDEWLMNFHNACPRVTRLVINSKKYQFA